VVSSKIAFEKDGKHVVATVTHKGIEIEAFGFTGTSCVKAMAEIEERLGTIVEREEKPEFYERDSTCEQVAFEG